MKTEKENNFFEKIHCRFPYHDKELCLQLIEEGVLLSTDSAFKIIEELARITKDDRKGLEDGYLKDLLSMTSSKFEHPMKEMIVEVAKKMIDSEGITVDEAVSKLESVRKFPGQYSALSILYFSCNDKEEKLDPIWKDIINEWNK